LELLGFLISVRYYYDFATTYISHSIFSIFFDISNYHKKKGVFLFVFFHFLFFLFISVIFSYIYYAY